MPGSPPFPRRRHPHHRPMLLHTLLPLLAFLLSASCHPTSASQNASLSTPGRTMHAFKPVRSSTRPSSTTSPPPFDVDARIRGYWKELDTRCSDRNYTSCKGMDRSLWTDPQRLQLSDFKFNGLGRWSSFRIRTSDHHGRVRERGGDSWFVMLRDRRQRLKVATRVFDEGDGTYTVAAVLHKPGNYTMGAWLWYSNCHGLQEPKVAFSELESALNKTDHCYIGTLVRRQVFPGAAAAAPEQAACDACAAADAATAPPPGGRVWRTERYMYRQNRTIRSVRCCRPPPLGPPGPQGPTQRFVFYGDSTVKNSWEVLMYPARRPCRMEWKPRDVQEMMMNPEQCISVSSMAELDPEMDQILQRCTGGLPWTSAAVGTNLQDLLQHFPMSMYFNMSDFRYNDTYIRSHVPPIPLSPAPREFTVVYADGWGCRIPEFVTPDLRTVRRGDVLVVNIGAHCQRTMQFDDWRRYMDEIAAELKQIIESTGVPVIWRTTFLIEETVFRSHPEHVNGYVPQAHFNTDARRIMFDSYVEDVLLPVGVHVWDVYGAAAVGDNKPHDMFHTDAPTIWAMNKDMMDAFVCM